MVMITAMKSRMNECNHQKRRRLFQLRNQAPRLSFVLMFSHKRRRLSRVEKDNSRPQPRKVKDGKARTGTEEQSPDGNSQQEVKVVSEFERHVEHLQAKGKMERNLR